MAKRMLIDAIHSEEMRVAIADNSQIFEFDFVTATKKQVKGNIYLAKITRVEPSLQAAFVEYGGGKQGFLPFAEIHPDYYQIPMVDRKRLIEEVERENALLEAELDAETGTPAEATAENAAGEGGEGLADAGFAAADMPAEEMRDVTQGTDQEAAPMPLEFALPLQQEALSQEDITAFEPAARMAEGAGEAVIVSEPLEGLPQESGAESAEPASATESGGAEASATREEAVETIASEEEEISGRRKRVPFFKRYRIQEVIKRGQIVLVQVIKEERGNKGVSLTTYLSLAGRYCVLMPNSPRDGGVSRKISDGETRKRLKSVMSELKTARGMSVIIRTAGIDRTRAEIKRDFDYLVKLWNHVREDTLAANAPALIYEEGDLIKRAIRDQYTNDIDEVLVEGEEAYKSARDFMKMLLPSHTPRVKQYRENTPLFYAYGIEEQLLSMHDPAVKLKSGGYIVLSPTEALISIDVNSGRSTGERNIEETATKTNLEAAAEIARQLRLRDLAGLIVIDFIDMMESRNRRNVERALKEALKADRAKIQLGRISPFGLLEMSRQRLRSSIAEASSIQCPHCVGRGIIRSNESMTIQLIRNLEKEAATGQWATLKLTVPEHMAMHVLNAKRQMLSTLEERYGVQILVQVDHAMTASAFTIEKSRRGNPDRSERPERPERAERQESRRFGSRRDRDRRPAYAEQEAEAVAETQEASAAEENAPEESLRAEEGEERTRGRRRRRRRGGSREGGEVGAGTDAAESTEDAELAESTPSGEGIAEETPRPGRGRNARGGRGRRRWKDNDRGANNGAEYAEAESGGDGAINAPAARPPAEEKPAFVQEPLYYAAASGNGGGSYSFAPENPPAQQQQQVHALPATRRPEGAPPKRGWWQKMIELD